MYHLGGIAAHQPYAALVGVSANGVVGYAHGTPHHFLMLVATASHHLHDPSLIGIADGKGFALAVIAVFLGQRSHHLDGLTGITCPL